MHGSGCARGGYDFAALLKSDRNPSLYSRPPGEKLIWQTGRSRTAKAEVLAPANHRCFASKSAVPV